MLQNALIRKIRLISNFMMPQPGQERIVLQILSNISRSKGNKTMKFDPLIENNMRNIFLKHHTENMVEKLVPDPFMNI